MVPIGKGFISLAVGLVLIFVIQILNFLTNLLGVTFIKDGKVIETPIHFGMYIIPLIFVATGIYLILKEKKY